MLFRLAGASGDCGEGWAGLEALVGRVRRALRPFVPYRRKSVRVPFRILFRSAGTSGVVPQVSTAFRILCQALAASSRASSTSAFRRCRRTARVRFDVPYFLDERFGDPQILLADCARSSKTFVLPVRGYFPRFKSLSMVFACQDSFIAGEMRC